MISKDKYSKIMEIQRELFYHKKITRVNKNHFDYGHSIVLKYDDGLDGFAGQYSVVNTAASSEPLNIDAQQFSKEDYYVDSFSSRIPDTGMDEIVNQKYATQKEDYNNEDDKYKVTRYQSGTSEDGTQYVEKKTETYDDEIAYQERPGGQYSAESAFNEDIRAILSGQKLYNDEQKQLVASTAQSFDNASDTDYDYSTQSSKITDSHNNGLRNQEVTNPHAIFDSMALSFGNAKSYDLGTLNLDKSFTDIEEAIARKEQHTENKKKDINENDGSVVENAIPVLTGINAGEGGSKPITTNDFIQQLSLNNLDLAEDLAIISDNTKKDSKQNNSPSVKTVADKHHICEADQYNQSFSIPNFSASLAATPALQSLLSYLNIDYPTFQPLENRYFQRLKELLLFHKIITTTDVIDSASFMDKVKDFQKNILNDPNPDGIPGENTLFELQKGWAGKRGLKLIKSGIRNDAYNGSQIGFVLRSDALILFNQLYDAIHHEGGVITSAGSFRDLSASTTAGRSSTSMHYTGLALDLHTGSGMQNTSTDPYLVERVATNRWQVWNKVQSPNGSMQNLNAQIYNSNSKSVAPLPINERVIDFKQMANINGFKDIGNRSCFPADYMCAEWWHFQCEAVLVPYLSQFGAELLTIYSENELASHPNIWQNKKKIFKKDWF